MTSDTPLAITATPSGFSITGEIDAYTAPQIGRSVASSALPVVVIDLSGVEFVDSSGLRALIEAHQQLEADGRSLQLAHPSPAVTRLFEISGVGEYLDVAE